MAASVVAASEAEAAAHAGKVKGRAISRRIKTDRTIKTSRIKTNKTDKTVRTFVRDHLNRLKVLIVLTVKKTISNRAITN